MFALCKGKTDLFFATSAENIERAKRICRRCGVVSECLEEALDEPGLQGTWGATTERERRQLRRVMRSAG